MNPPAERTVALIHAGAASIAPAVDAFAEVFPRARLWHLLDDRLVVDADAAGRLTAPLRGRMRTLIEYAVANGADAVQLACSMYGPAADDPVTDGAGRPVPVLASDRATFEAAAQAGSARVLVVASLASAAADTRARLESFLGERGVGVPVSTLVVPGAAAAASSADRELLTRLVTDAVLAGARPGDVVALAQYSLAPVRTPLTGVLAARDVSVLSPPHDAAAALAVTLQEPGGAAS